MSSTEFIVNIDGQNFGPVDVTGLRYLFEKKRVTYETFIYDKEAKAWIFLGDLSEFKDLVPAKPKAQLDRPLIFIVAQGRLQGPFTSALIIQKIRAKELRPFDLLLIEGQKDLAYVRDVKRFFHEFGTPAQEADAFEGLDSLLTKKEFDTLMEKVFKNNPKLLRKKELVDERQKLEGEQDENIHADHFEIANDAIWQLEKDQRPGQTEIPSRRYLDVLQLIQEGKITRADRVKKIWDKEWRAVADIYEFTTTAVRKVVDVGGLKVEKLFIKRQHPRASYYSPVIIKIGDKEMRGTCTVISIGGCFIDLAPKDLKVGDRIHLKFMPAAIPLEFEVNADIACILPKKPQGIGCKFVDLEENIKVEIGYFVEKYLKKMKSK